MTVGKALLGRCILSETAVPVQGKDVWPCHSMSSLQVQSEPCTAVQLAQALKGV